MTPAGGAETKFKGITEAYEVLSDSEKRGRYGQFRNRAEHHPRYSV